jgi:manganese/iron transport system ATP-binding protein
VRHLTVTYRNGFTACATRASRCRPARSAALVGVNGSGKSTLFKAIMGFVPLAAASVRDPRPAGREALKRNLVAYVPQARRSTGTSRCWSRTW